ncbi:peptide deformylase [Vagococcus fluvialis]|jgi:peptide deformylase|uniref:Peptide deformylase n=1 Tax=Vagococcus fluvialis TaxID=2738 RepID=A0A369AYZ7_9ENTE|nr:peptide deformylase [Vagococcus fluvialis]MDR2277094.1 peptide deformylase [Vagococcus sp.]OTP33638.1 peptide deformylase [Enterococcus sp. 6C8_DIV0013]MBO0420776.1 peptide deformylase [Vagococcus fluvialis]MCM2139350.1 peptide deformylase [Vagococcus fluvialis]MDT2780610.1 peptide deformylase [Vagococcus fluvialis]
MRKIIKYPHIALTQPTKKVKEIDDELIILLDEMHEIIKKEDAIGIAANQLGVLKRVCVVELDEETGLFEMINPEIVKHSGKSIDIEGCLSFPDVYGTVERYEEVTIRYVDRDGYEMEVDATDYLARAFQHEIEHLDGKVFTDKIIETIAPENLATFMEENGYD